MSQTPHGERHFTSSETVRDLVIDASDGLTVPFAQASALTITGSYIAGGFIPLSPYMLLANAHSALLVSVAVTLLALMVFGYIKGQFTGVSPLRSGFQTMLIGGIAAAAAFAIARAIS